MKALGIGSRKTRRTAGFDFSMAQAHYLLGSSLRSYSMTGKPNHLPEIEDVRYMRKYLIAGVLFVGYMAIVIVARSLEATTRSK